MTETENPVVVVGNGSATHRLVSKTGKTACGITTAGKKVRVLTDERPVCNRCDGVKTGRLH